VHQIGMLIAFRLLSPFHYKTLGSICVSGCVWYGGNWMAQTLGHMLTNWLLIMHGWPLKPSTARGPTHFYLKSSS